MAAKLAKEELQKLSPSSTNLSEYVGKPVQFLEEVFGLTVWDWIDDAPIDRLPPSLLDIVPRLEKEDRFSWGGGHKMSKSTCVSGMPIYFAAVLGWKVVLMMPTGHQLKDVLWKNILDLSLNATKPLPGKFYETYTHGYKIKNGGSITGVAVDSHSSFAGFSRGLLKDNENRKVVFILDESNGIKQPVIDGVFGNAAGGAAVWLLGNLTEVTGSLYDTQMNPTPDWFSVNMSSLDVARYAPPIPGLATLKWCEERREAWGEKSSEYQVRVLGKPPTQGDSSFISVTDVRASMALHKGYRLPFIPEHGIVIGLDVARFGDDSTVLCPRRNLYVFDMESYQKADSNEIVGRVKNMVKRLQMADETSIARIPRPVINVDGGGGYGSGVVDILRETTDFEVNEVNSASVSDLPERYNNLRTQLIAGVDDFLKEGGVIPNDNELATELVATQYKIDSRGRRKAEPKEDIKKRLRRSPDRADALALCVYTSSKKNTVQSMHIPNL